MHGDHVGPSFQQSRGGIAFNRGIEPGEGPVDVNLHVGVDPLRAQGEGVDAPKHLGDREGGHIADLVGLSHSACGDARQVAGLVHAAEVVAEVGVVHLVTAGVLEDHLRVLAGQLLHGVHVAEGGGEDDVGPLVLDEVHHEVAEVRAFLGHALHEQGDAVGVLLGVAAALVMGPRPPGVAYRPHVDEGSLPQIGAIGLSGRGLGGLGGRSGLRRVGRRGGFGCI